MEIWSSFFIPSGFSDSVSFISRRSSDLVASAIYTFMYVRPKQLWVYEITLPIENIISIICRWEWFSRILIKRNSNNGHEGHSTKCVSLYRWRVNDIGDIYRFQHSLLNWNKDDNFSYFLARIQIHDQFPERFTFCYIRGERKTLHGILKYLNHFDSNV